MVGLACTHLGSGREGSQISKAWSPKLSPCAGYLRLALCVLAVEISVIMCSSKQTGPSVMYLTLRLKRAERYNFLELSTHLSCGLCLLISQAGASSPLLLYSAKRKMRQKVWLKRREPGIDQSLGRRQ